MRPPPPFEDPMTMSYLLLARNADLSASTGGFEQKANQCK